MENEKKATIASVSLQVLVVCIALFTSTNVVSAQPVIGSVSVSPPNPWIGWDVEITAECVDVSNDIGRFYANISGPDISFTNLLMGPVSGNTYGVELQGSDLTGTGDYDVNVGCVNVLGEEDHGSGFFRVSRLTGDITGVFDAMGQSEDGVVYAEEDFYAYFLIQKDGAPVIAGVDFQAVLNNEEVTIANPIPFENGKGQRLRITAPESEGNYVLELRAEYQGEEVTGEVQVEVMDMMELEMLSIDKTSISEAEPITMNLMATQRGDPLAIKEQDLSITLDSAEAEINSIRQDGDSYRIEFTPPGLYPGKYTLRVEFSHGSKIHSIEREFTYVIPLSGQISQNGKGLKVQIKFTDENGVSTAFATDSTGLYSGTISPGTYDIMFEHSESKIVFYDVSVDEFDDPIRYNYMGAKNIPGIDNTGLFVYETALSFSQAAIEMRYNEKAVEYPESLLRVYKCSDWNGDSCYSEWEEVSSDIDTVRDIARVTVDSLSAYSVGTREGIGIEIGIDKETYNLHETMTLDGIATYDDNNKLEDAMVTASIKGVSESKTTNTDSEGLFSMDFVVPDKEGEYTIEVTVEKEPFSSVTVTQSFSVVKSRGVSLTVPTGIRLDVMGNKTVGISVKNTGQLTLTGLSVLLEDVPEDIVADIKTAEKDDIGPQEELSMSVDFKSVKNVTKTYTMKVIVDSEEGVSAEKTIALTTERRGVISDTGGISSGIADVGDIRGVDFSLVGNVIANVGSSVGYLLALFVGSVSFALIMRKKRLSRVIERVWVKNKLSSIRLEINKKSDVSSAGKNAVPERAESAAVTDAPSFPLGRTSTQLEDVISSMNEWSGMNAAGTRRKRGVRVKKKNKSKKQKKIRRAKGKKSR